MPRTRDEAPRRLVGYTRVSTSEQAREGVSLGAQARKIEQFAEMDEVELVAMIEDAGVSAKSLKRDGLSRALAMLDAGEADGLVVYKLDRLTRSMGDWQFLIRKYFDKAAGKRLASVTDSIDTRSPGGRMVLNMLMSIAEWERETIIERTQEAMTAKKGMNQRVGRGSPYGKAIVVDGQLTRGNQPKTLADDVAEAEAIARVLAAPGRSLRKLAADLEAAAIPTRSGKPWSPWTVRNLIASGRFAAIGETLTAGDTPKPTPTPGD